MFIPELSLLIKLSGNLSDFPSNDRILLDEHAVNIIPDGGNPLPCSQMPIDTLDSSDPPIPQEGQLDDHTDPEIWVELDKLAADYYCKTHSSSLRVELPILAKTGPVGRSHYFPINSNNVTLRKGNKKKQLACNKSSVPISSVGLPVNLSQRFDSCSPNIAGSSSTKGVLRALAPEHRFS